MKSRWIFYKIHSVTSIYRSAATLKPLFFVPEELWSFVVWTQDLWMHTLWYLAWEHLQLILWIFGDVVQDLYRPGSGHHINKLGTLGTLSCREWLMLKLGYTHTVTQGSLLKCGHISVTPFSSSDRQICLPVTTDLSDSHFLSNLMFAHLIFCLCLAILPGQRRGLSAGREWQELWCQDSASVCVCVIWVLSQNFYLASGFPSSFQPLWTSCNKQAHWQKWRKLKREEWGNRYNRR